MDMNEIEPTIQNINESIYEEDLSIVIDELVNYYLKMVNEGREGNVRRQHILDYINNHRINLQEIYNWLFNNQNDSNAVWLLGYFNYHGIETNINKQKAFVFYQKASELDNVVAQYSLTKMYMNGEGVEKNHDKVFELSKQLAEKGYSNGISWLGYCYDCGIGTPVNMQKAFEVYQKAANLGNSVAQYNLALIYEYGIAIKKDVNKAIYWYEKSTKQGYKKAQSKLEKLSKK